MVEIDPSDKARASSPPPTTAGPASGRASFPSTKSHKSDGWDQFRDYLGEENFKKFQGQLQKTISDQMGKERAKAHEASEKLGRAERGEPVD